MTYFVGPLLSGRAQVNISPSGHDLVDGKETAFKEAWLNFCYKGSRLFICILIHSY